MKKFILSVIALVALLSGCATERKRIWGLHRQSYYKTIQGDTLEKIVCKFDDHCDSYNRAIDEMKIYNKTLLEQHFQDIDRVNRDTPLPAGLLIRLKRKPKIEGDLYVVEEGDSLEEIASRSFSGKHSSCKINELSRCVQDLRNWNKLGNRNIYVGQTLRVTDPDPSQILNRGEVMRVAQNKYKIISGFTGMNADIHRVYFITRDCDVEGFDHNVWLVGKHQAKEYNLLFNQHYRVCQLINIVKN